MKNLDAGCCHVKMEGHRLYPHLDEQEGTTWSYIYIMAQISNTIFYGHSCNFDADNHLKEILERGLGRRRIRRLCKCPISELMWGIRSRSIRRMLVVPNF